MNKMTKAFAFLAVAMLLAISSSSSVSANPYNQYESIGSYYQYQYGYRYTGSNYVAPGGPIVLPNPYYNYPSVPRAGGWFGGGAGWITGLRQPYYGCVLPVHYSYGVTPNCGSRYGGWGGYGGSMNYRIRSGGMFVY